RTARSRSRTSFLPSTKNVALMLRRRNVSRTCGVTSGSGPLSNDSVIVANPRLLSSKAACPTAAAIPHKASAWEMTACHSGARHSRGGRLIERERQADGEALYKTHRRNHRPQDSFRHVWDLEDHICA